MSNFFDKFLQWLRRGLPAAEEVQSAQAKSDVKKSYKIGQDLYLKVRCVPGNLTIEAFSTLRRLRVFPNGGPYFFHYEASEKKCTQHIDGKQYYGLKWIYYTNEPKKYTQCVVHWLLENFNDDWHGTGAGRSDYTRYREGDVQVTGADRRMQIDYLLNPVDPIERSPKRPRVMAGQV
jgi:hypothetical protein